MYCTYVLQDNGMWTVNQSDLIRKVLYVSMAVFTALAIALA